MRKVILAETAGFCFGVKRAVDTVYEQVKKGNDAIYTYGPIIHNEEVVSDMEKKGVCVLTKEECFQSHSKRTVTAGKDSCETKDLKEKGTIVIRSHGVSKAEYDMLENAGWTCIDATCPFVKKIHNIVSEESKKGSHIVIIGNANHPEVMGIRGWVESQSTVIETEEEARDFAPQNVDNICIVSQTTFNNNKFKDLVEILQKKGYNTRCVNTICNATEKRQREARQIAGQVEAMIVIGGRHSSNTQKLYEICKQECENTYYIQTLSDLDIPGMQDYDSIGITAGASTPKNIIEEVQKNVRNEF